MHRIALEVVRLPDAKRGFVLLPRRCETVAGLHFLAFACLLLTRTIKLFVEGS